MSNYHGFNTIWRINNIIIKRYNRQWVESSDAVLSNIILGNKFAKFCQNQGVNAVAGLLDEPVFHGGYYWQIFNYIKGDMPVYEDVLYLNKSLSMLESTSFIKSYKYIDDFFLSPQNLMQVNRIDKLLKPWYKNSPINNADGFFHRDLRPENVIKQNKKLYLIDFDYSGPRNFLVDQLAQVLDFGCVNLPNNLLDTCSLFNFKEKVLPALLEEWRIWYKHLAYLSMYDELTRQENIIKNRLLPQLSRLFRGCKNL